MEHAFQFDFIIIGAGISGASAFHWLSTIPNTKTLIIESKDEKERFESARILVGHAKQFLQPEVPTEDPKIFVRPVKSIGHSSKNDFAIIHGFQEFGEYFGTVIDEQNLIKWFLIQGQKRGGTVSWNSKAKSIKQTENAIEIEFEKQKEIIKAQCALVLIATGPYAPELQKTIGFDVPDCFNYLSATFHAKPEDIEATFKMDWDYHLNPKISPVGPFQMTRAIDFFNIIMLGNEPYEVMEEKLLRILKNYEKVKYMFQKTRERPESLTASDFRRGKEFKHPVKKFYMQNAVLLGEATGFVTECYNEGLLGALASSKFIYETIIEIVNSKKEKGLAVEYKDFSEANLKKYQEKFENQLFKNFHLSQKASEAMFLSPGNYQQEIWDAYISAIKSDRTVRKNIHNAWASPNLVKYELENDEYCGEKIYLALPLGAKVALTPKFLKMKFFK